MTAEGVTAETHELRRLPFIDGVRGIAALLVAAGHFYFEVPTVASPRLQDAGTLDLIVWPLRFGNEMVFLFLMISGYSLYYSERSRIARTGKATTYRQFAARRAWRILPVYYVAMALGLLLLVVVPAPHLRPENQISTGHSVGAVLSHLFLVHNLHSSWLYQVNSPLWSIAYEAQLYVLFPLIFIGMRRQNPLLVALVVVALVKVISLFHLGFPVFGLARWFVAGALVAEAAARGLRIPLRISLPVGLAALLLGMAQLQSLSSELRHDGVWLLAFSLLLFAMQDEPMSRANPMNLRFLRWLGLRSYSLYALHFPLVLVVLWVAEEAHAHGRLEAALLTLVGLPAAILMAAINFKFLEGPTLERVRAVGTTTTD